MKEEWMSVLDKNIYAHRGYHKGKNSPFPENSLAAFRRAKENGFGAELDVHLLKDGNLAVIHDSELERMTGRDGVVEDLETKDLKKCHLGKSGETIPTFEEVLDVVDGKVPLIIELKGWKHNSKALCQKTMQVLDQYKGVYCIESFYPSVVVWMKNHRPDVIRGQLSQNFLKRPEGLPRPVAYMATQLWENVLGQPDFVAYRFEDRDDASNRNAIQKKKKKSALWTIRSLEDYHTTLSEGAWPIFENFEPDVLPER